jgi:hypothetical protein
MVDTFLQRQIEQAKAAAAEVAERDAVRAKAAQLPALEDEARRKAEAADLAPHMQMALEQAEFVLREAVGLSAECAAAYEIYCAAERDWLEARRAYSAKASEGVRYLRDAARFEARIDDQLAPMARDQFGNEQRHGCRRPFVNFWEQLRHVVDRLRPGPYGGDIPARHRELLRPELLSVVIQFDSRPDQI